MSVNPYPIQREALLDIEFVGWILVEHDLRDESVNGHDGHLARDLNAAVLDPHVLAGTQLVQLHSALCVLHVLAEALLGVLGRGDVDLLGWIHAFSAALRLNLVAQCDERLVEQVVGELGEA